MPGVLHLVICCSRRGLELVLSEEVQPSGRLFVNPDALLMHIVEGRKKRCGDICKLIDMPLVLHNRILKCFQNTALRNISNASCLDNADRIVRNSVFLAVDRLTQLKRQRVLSLDERHAVRDDRILSVCFLIDIHIRNL